VIAYVSVNLQMGMRKGQPSNVLSWSSGWKLLGDAGEAAAAG
jgi:hypothetical protein